MRKIATIVALALGLTLAATTPVAADSAPVPPPSYDPTCRDMILVHDTWQEAEVLCGASFTTTDQRSYVDTLEWVYMSCEYQFRTRIAEDDVRMVAADERYRAVIDRQQGQILAQRRHLNGRANEIRFLRGELRRLRAKVAATERGPLTAGSSRG